MKKKIYLIIIFLVLIGVFFYFRHRNVPIQRRTRFLLDTYVTIQAPGDDKTLAVIDKAMDRIAEIGVKFNPIDTASPIYAFNNGDAPLADSEILKIVKISLDVAKKSYGVFDITVFPLVKLWGFETDTPALPSKEAIKEAMTAVGLKYIKIEGNELVKAKKGAGIELGGIAKGYAIKEALRILTDNGVKNALIDAGGDLYALGKIKGRAWKIGIRNPRGDGVIGSLDATDIAVVTSGDYERYFIKDGVRYCHILNSKTGYPARGLMSVTVVAADPVLADAWSTALFVLGPQKALRVAEEVPEIEAVLVTDTGAKLVTKGLKGI